jgi:hypothetical protein
MAFETTPEAPQGEKLLVADRSGRSIERVEEGRGVALGEDQMVVVGIVGPPVVVAEILVEQHRHHSAADIAEVGWPEPAVDVARIESTRSCCASSRQRSARLSAGERVVVVIARSSLEQPVDENTDATDGHVRVPRFPSGSRSPAFAEIRSRKSRCR